MTRRYSLLTGLLVLGAGSALSLRGLTDPPSGSVRLAAPIVPLQATTTPLARNFGGLPLSFESNQGQTDRAVRFLTHTGDNTLFLTPSEAVFSMTTQSPSQPKGQDALHPGRTGGKLPTKRTNAALRMQMVGADPKATALTQQPLAGRINYFIGKDPSKWHVGVPTFGRVGFHGVYKGVDLVYYGNRQHLEYDFLVAAHADPKQIMLRFAGAQGVRVNAAGDLLVRTAGRELTWRRPTVYQQGKAGKQTVAARFHLKPLSDGRTGVSFALGHYDTARSLVIDPVLLYSTYLGGNSNDSATGIAVDSNGNAYVTGYTLSTDFPTTPGAFQRADTPVSGTAFVSKLNSTGTALVYSTYLGGSGGREDRANSIAVDSSGNAYVTGFASSLNFPTTAGAFQRVNKGLHIPFVTKLNPSGTAILYSTYLGGSDQDEANGIVVDSSGNAYVTGFAGSIDFPITPGAFQQTKSTGENVFVTKLNSFGTVLLYSTFLGGSYFDWATGIAIDSSGNAYVTGFAGSIDFPTTPNAYQRVNNARGLTPDSAFVTKLNSTGTALVYSTYLGGSHGAGAYGIAIDSSGSAYVVGSTSSADFPTTPNAFQSAYNAQTLGYENAFVTKLNATGSALLYSTYLSGLSGAMGDGASGIAVDVSGNAYIVGHASSTDFPTTPGAFQRVNNAQGSGFGNAFLTKLNAAGTALLYSTYLGGLGGNSNDQANGIAIDSLGNAYVVGYAYSADFPTTFGAFQRAKATTDANRSNAFVTRLSAKSIFPDFNNDGFTDLLIQNASTHQIASWFMQGANWVGGSYFSLIPPSDYALVGAGDFLGNGATTLVLQSRTTNQIAYWFTTGANHATINGGQFVNVTPPLDWKVVGVGDFNSDGKSDLVFQSQTTGQVAVWFMNGPYYAGGVLLPITPATGLKMMGVGDFNGDGRPDLVLQNQSTGQLEIWVMNGVNYLSTTVLTTIPAPGYRVVGVGDYNGDGSADLLFQNLFSNQAVVWYLSNGAYAGGASLSLTPPPGWQIIGPR